MLRVKHVAFHFSFLGFRIKLTINFLNSTSPLNSSQSDQANLTFHLIKHPADTLFPDLLTTK